MAPGIWFCDVCGDEIADPMKGLLVWKVGDNLVKSDFRVVHKGDCDRITDPNHEDYTIETQNLIGLDGQAWLFSLISYGPLKDGKSRGVADLDQWIDVFRRFQTPWYEQARKHFAFESIREQFSDANETLPYEQRYLEEIAKVEE
jgi:hypothetical protein